MKGDNKVHWTWVKNQRIKDIEAQEKIGNPDKELMNLLLQALEEAKQKLIKLNE